MNPILMPIAKSNGKANTLNIMRYNGGPQAAHHVVTSKNQTHCFAMFGSGMFTPGVLTYLSKYTLINPLAIIEEAARLQQLGVANPLGRMYVSSEALVITPFQKIANRMRELARGEARHGSCGMGVGEAVRDSQLTKDPLQMGDLKTACVAKRKLLKQQLEKIALAEELVVADNPDSVDLLARLKWPKYVDWLFDKYLEALAKGLQIVEAPYVKTLRDENLILEGAQGVLLDPRYGLCWPHVTKTNTTLENGQALLQDMAYSGPVHNLATLRVLPPRHGAGTLVTEDKRLTKLLPERHNATNPWQREFRLGWPDLLVTRYALEVARNIHSIALTHLDTACILPEIKVCTHYIYTDKPSDDFAEFFEWKTRERKIHIDKILVPKTPTRKRQQRLGKLLAKCEPGYINIGGWNKPTLAGARHYIDFLERELDVPISVASFGPTERDKIQLRPLT